MIRDDLKLEIVRQYYLQNLGQSQIAKKLGISRSYVSKLLIESRKEKLVEIKINSPYMAESEDEELLRTRYNLKKVSIVSADEESFEGSRIQAKEMGQRQSLQEIYYQKLGAAVNEFLNATLKKGDIIGVAWGKTIYECSKKIESFKEHEDLSVVQLCGGVSQFENSTYSNEILNHFAEGLRARPYALPLPAIVESKQYKDVFLKEHSISQVMNMIQKIKVALFTVGRCDKDSALVRSGYIIENEMAGFIEEGAVGEVCTHFINREGKCVSQELEDRTLAVSMEILKNCETKIVLILGEKRLETLKAVLLSGYANVLVIDEPAAKKLIEQQEE